MRNKHNVPEHTIEYFSKKPKGYVKHMIAKCKRENDIKNMEQWQYIAFRLGITDKEKVIFT